MSSPARDWRHLPTVASLLRLIRMERHTLGDGDDEMLPVPERWLVSRTGQPLPNVVAELRRSRDGH